MTGSPDSASLTAMVPPPADRPSRLTHPMNVIHAAKVTTQWQDR